MIQLIFISHYMHKFIEIFILNVPIKSFARMKRIIHKLYLIMMKICENQEDRIWVYQHTYHRTSNVDNAELADIWNIASFIGWKEGGMGLNTM